MNPLLLGPLFEIGKSILDRVIPDKAAAEKAKLEMEAALQSQLDQQRHPTVAAGVPWASAPVS